ncbi:hypothetical protein CIPAW_11G131400 [Carya illinoinensis]|uniref:Uncharacterized protein n=1 Tax=Carya illinoinensis TaxID=32201 RepID=A0A8T1P5T2_CARIL|nr:hypothetical protein CIPAW_11G131400 [Carya illinoinensis]
MALLIPTGESNDDDADGCSNGYGAHLFNNLRFYLF